MISWLSRIIGASTLFLALLGFIGCAGSKKSSSNSDYGSSQAEESKSQKLEDARRAAEDAEMKAHELRQGKAKPKSSSN